MCCRVFTFSDDEEEEKRVVRSQKDKRWTISDASMYAFDDVIGMMS